MSTVWMIVFIFATCCATAIVADPTTLPNSDAKFTFVLVHGAWGGAWSFKQVDQILRANGHTVYRPTLTGLGERVHLASPNIDLDTHITDVVNTILFEDLHDVVLLGHSYGGMVVTGVVDRVPDRIKRVIYLDAFLPEDGESVNALRAMSPNHPLPRAAVNGFIIPQWIKGDEPLPHDVPHPEKTFSEPISLKNPAARNVPGSYILTVDPGNQPAQDQFYPFYKRAQDRSWPTQVMVADHNPQRSMPQNLVNEIFQAIK